MPNSAVQTRTSLQVSVSACEAYRRASAEQIKMHAKMSRDQDDNFAVNYQMAWVRQPILSVSEAVQKNVAVWFSPASDGICRVDDVELR